MKYFDLVDAVLKEYPSFFGPHNLSRNIYEVLEDGKEIPIVNYDAELPIHNQTVRFLVQGNIGYCPWGTSTMHNEIFVELDGSFEIAKTLVKK